MTKRIYFDHNATTRPRQEVISLQMEAANAIFGNPSSLHQEGRSARNLLELARGQVASFLTVRPEEIIFTSGGTEGNNSAILGVCRHLQSRLLPKMQMISSPLEHPSIRKTLQFLSEKGWPIAMLTPDRRGRLDLGELEALLAHQKTALVTLSYCNHEIGNLYPIREMADLAHRYGAIFHCDAVQAVGRVPVDFSRDNVDLATISAHKFYGPKGVGALFCRGLMGNEILNSFLFGGEQEKGRRAGTQPVPLIAGFGKACELSEVELSVRMEKIKSLRDRLEKKLLLIEGASVNGDVELRNPGTCHMSFSGVEGALLMMSLDLQGVAVSTGAACSSGSAEPSPVLLALGYSKKEALAGVRFSLGQENTEEEVDEVVKQVENIVHRVRGLNFLR